MRLIHTADWHIGQTLHGFPRQAEHAAFLGWLLDQIELHEADALIIAGDVFEVASPSSEAQQQYYGFLAECRRRFADLDVIVVGGNHDSPARLDAPSELLVALGMTVVGGMPRQPDGAIDLDRAIAPIRNRAGETVGWVLAVPFLRPRDLPELPGPPMPTNFEAAHEKLVAGYRRLYEMLTERAQQRRTEGQALIATGHCYMAEGVASELSERKVQVGHQHALPVDIFPESISYVALGHLHREQRVAGLNRIRYSGSPIPLSVVERTYRHQVLLQEFDGARLSKTTPLLVPRHVDMHVVPEHHAPFPEVQSALMSLMESIGPTVEHPPLLEVRVALDTPRPRLRQEIEALLEGHPVRLVRIDVKSSRAAGERQAAAPVDVEALTPAQVFEARYRRVHEGAPPPHLVALFEELLDRVARESDA